MATKKLYHGPHISWNVKKPYLRKVGDLCGKHRMGPISMVTIMLPWCFGGSCIQILPSECSWDGPWKMSISIETNQVTKLCHYIKPWIVASDQFDFLSNYPLLKNPFHNGVILFCTSTESRDITTFGHTHYCSIYLRQTYANLPRHHGWPNDDASNILVTVVTIAWRLEK